MILRYIPQSRAIGVSGLYGLRRQGSGVISGGLRLTGFESKVAEAFGFVVGSSEHRD